MACLTTSSTTAPTTATNRLQTLKPSTPVAPARWKRKPPTTAPAIPRTMSTSMPSPVLFTILLAMKPETSPRTIHAMIDIVSPPQLFLRAVHRLGQRVEQLARQGLGERLPRDR